MSDLAAAYRLMQAQAERAASLYNALSVVAYSTTCPDAENAMHYLENVQAHIRLGLSKLGEQVSKQNQAAE